MPSRISIARRYSRASGVRGMGVSMKETGGRASAIVGVAR